LITSAIFLVTIAALLTVALLVWPRHRQVVFMVACWIPLFFVTARVLWRAFGLNGYTGHLQLSTTLQGLPLNMCGVASLILPIVAMKRERVPLVVSFAYFFSMPGAIVTLVLGNAAPKSMLDPEYWIYFVPHSLYVVVPVAMAVTGFLRPRIKDIPWVILLVAALITVAHLLNLAINAAFGPLTVNYINTMWPGDMIQATGQWSTFPIMGTLFEWTGGAVYWYLYLLLPILLTLQGLLALPLIPGERARKRAARIAATATPSLT